MKTNWEYIIEDIQKSVTQNRNAAIREGKREGKLDGLFEIAQKMIKGGESLDKITLYTGFSKTKIEKIKREMNLYRT